VQRASGAPLVQYRTKRKVSDDPGSAAHHYVLRCPSPLWRLAREAAIPFLDSLEAPR